MTRIRVLAMISSMRGGGSEKQTLMLLQHLDRDKFEPHLFLLEKTGSFLDQVPEDVTIHDGALVGPSPRSYVPRLYVPGRLFRQQAKQLREICQCQKIDVIYDRTFRMTLLASAAIDSLSIPRVSTIVSPPNHAVPLVEKRWVAIKRRRLAAAYRASHRVIAVSDQARRSAIEYYGLSDDQVECLPNPVDQLGLRATVGLVDGGLVDGGLEDSGPKTRRKTDGSPYTIVVVGRMSVEKGHADLIRAIELLDRTWPTDQPTLAIRMIGDGPLKESLEESATRLKLHRMEFLGAIASPAREIAMADALILPSHFEGMPNVVLEAMTLGTDVIATRSGGTIELERDEPTVWWADPKNPESLAAAIKLWAGSPDEAVCRNQAAIRMVAEHHDVAKATSQIEEYLAGN